VKGEDEGLRENLASLAEQDCPGYELIVRARRAADIPAGMLPPRVKIVLAGVRAAPHGWLRALVEPLGDTSAGAATGYRWYAHPALRSLWNGVIAGAFGPRPCLFAWGGATAIPKETFFAAGVAEAWKNAISDDYRLSGAVRKAGLRIVFAPGAMVHSTGRATTREFFGWARRQLLITRFYARVVWRLAFAVGLQYRAALWRAAGVERPAGPAWDLGLAGFVRRFGCRQHGALAWAAVRFRTRGARRIGIR
jgi:hypothetical protein